MTAAYLCRAARTPSGRFNGALAGVRPGDLAAHVVEEVVCSVPDLDPLKPVFRPDGTITAANASPLARVDAWGIDLEIVNVRGDAIAIGHPLGASGGRLLGTLAKVMAERGQRWGVAAICIGVGQALAVVLENVAV